MMIEFKFKPLVAAMFAASVLTACGGGGGGDGGTSTLNPGGTTQPGGTTNPGGTGGDNNPPPGGNNPPPGGDTSASRMTMYCPEGGTVQCSGENVLATENGVTLTNSGVQVIGRSTSDLNLSANTSRTTATGLALFDQGQAEIRMNKGNGETGAAPLMMLSNLDIKWDGTNERPRIIESFLTRQGRVELVNNLLNVRDLPAGSDTSFYNFATLRTGATQANYANNVYFPRCEGGAATCTTPETETDGVQQTAGDWRVGRSEPDWVSATRLHNDGDVHAGANVEEGRPAGVPGPGSKGYRSFDTLAFAHANLASWTTQDTVQMAEWTGLRGEDEHNTARRGVVAFGNVTDPALVPKTGSASYSGIFYGWHGADSARNPDVFRGVATVTVDFATRNVSLAFSNAAVYVQNGPVLPQLTFNTTARMGDADTPRANYMTGALSGTVTGGVSGRYFGPVVTTGESGAGPAEIAGALRFTTASGGTVIGGFIGRKN